MPPKSLKVAPQHIQLVKKALKRNGFSKQLDFAETIKVGRDTVRKFVNGKPVKDVFFEEACFELELDWQEIADQSEDIPDDPNFVGREAAIADLNNLSQKAKVILIQGVGKTTLAQKYLADRFKKVIDFPIGRETEDISPIEELLETNLRLLGEEPARDFGASLLQLKHKLQGEAIGILIDNLEPALDKDSRLIEPHRRYLELLRTLADPSVKSITLITSREALAEGVDISHYRLPILEVEAWRSYFNNRAGISNNQAILALYEVYKGNAMAMKLLCDSIFEDHAGDVATFWQEHQNLGTLPKKMENLVKDQFKRLKKNHPDAYRLLCRMGCYRYQDVPTVPLEGLFCLLWEDMPENKRGQVVRSLRDRSLVDYVKGEYQLHPLIQKQAIDLLKASKDEETANRKAAEFWTDSVKEVNTIEDSLRALEGYHHCLDFNDYELAANILTKKRPNQFNYSDSLGASFYQFGLLHKSISVIEEVKDKITEGYNLARLYNNLGDLYWLTGKLKDAINSHKKSRDIATRTHRKSQDIQTQRDLGRLEITSHFNIGLCLMDFGENKSAAKFFNRISLITEKLNDTYCLYSANFCLASINSSVNLNLARENIARFYNSRSKGDMTTWDLGYRHLFIALAHKNLGEIDKAFGQYNMAIQFAVDESDYPQVNAKALTGLAELYRIQKDHDKALDHHNQSIAILEKIGAKCDLAEAYYQLGLTHQAIGENNKSQTYFTKAINLWEEIDAPKQIAKVRNAMQL